MKNLISCGLIMVLVAMLGCEKLVQPTTEWDSVDISPDDDASAADLVEEAPDAQECGNGIVSPTEECDDGNTIDDGNGCDPQCRRNDRCGNGIVELLYEGCDDGNGELGDTCPDGPGGICQLARCGDGFVALGLEACDIAGAPEGTCSPACELLCDVGLADCNVSAADGCEIRLHGDPAHCGRCGHDCGGAECIKGYCQPILVKWGPNPWSDPRSLVVVRDYIYYTARYYDHWVPPYQTVYYLLGLRLDGVEGTIGIGNSPTEFWLLRFDADYLYWLDRYNGVLRRKLEADHWAPVEGVEDFDMDAAGVLDYVVDETAVYWSHPSSQSIVRIDKATGVHEPLPLTLEGPRTLAQDDEYLYYFDWSETDSVARLWRVLKTGESLPQLLATTSYWEPLIVDSTHVFWFNERYALGEGAIESVSLAGTANPIEVVKTFPTRTYFAVDDDYVYTTSWVGPDFKSGVITKTARDGSGEFVVVSKETAQSFGDSCLGGFLCFELYPIAIAVDERYIYWLQYGDANVFKVAK